MRPLNVRNLLFALLYGVALAPAAFPQTPTSHGGVRFQLPLEWTTFKAGNSIVLVPGNVQNPGDYFLTIDPAEEFSGDFSVWFHAHWALLRMGNCGLGRATNLQALRTRTLDMRSCMPQVPRLPIPARSYGFMPFTKAIGLSGSPFDR
jgi:hypothetical protein